MFVEVGPSLLHHICLLGPARFIAQPLSALRFMDAKRFFRQQ